MDNDDARTIYCGNLSDKVTEEILYELFLQGGPVQKISIPKDRDGKQRTFGFITYKHIYSVEYALQLFDGTALYNRPLNMKQRNSNESQHDKMLLNPVCNVNHMLEQGQQMILGNYPPRINDVGAVFNANIPQTVLPPLRQCDNAYPGNDDKNLKRSHPYRERERNRERERDRDRNRGRARERSRERNHNEHYRDERPYYRDNGYRSNNYSRYNNNRKRWTYH